MRAFVACEAAGRRDRGEVRRQCRSGIRVVRDRRNSGTGAEKTGAGSCEITRKERIYIKSGGSIERRLRSGIIGFRSESWSRTIILWLWRPRSVDFFRRQTLNLPSCVWWFTSGCVVFATTDQCTGRAGRLEQQKKKLGSHEKTRFLGGRSTRYKEHAS